MYQVSQCCFPTGRHYPGIAHLLGNQLRGLVEGLDPIAQWVDLPLIVMDVETTGLDPSQDRVIELGLAWNGGQESWLVNPGKPIPAASTEVHGLTDKMVANAPSFGEVAPKVMELMNGKIPVAYNAGFDRSFLLAELRRCGLSYSTETYWLDPLIWARELYSNAKSRALGQMASVLGILAFEKHRAGADASTAMQVMMALGKDDRVPKSYRELVSWQRQLSDRQSDVARRWRRFT